MSCTSSHNQDWATPFAGPEEEEDMGGGDQSENTKTGVVDSEVAPAGQPSGGGGVVEGNNEKGSYTI